MTHIDKEFVDLESGSRSNSENQIPSPSQESFSKSIQESLPLSPLNSYIKKSTRELHTKKSISFCSPAFREINKRILCFSISICICIIILIPCWIEVTKMFDKQNNDKMNEETSTELLFDQTNENCSEVYKFGFIYLGKNIPTRTEIYKCPTSKCQCEDLANQWLASSKKNILSKVYFQSDNPSNFSYVSNWENIGLPPFIIFLCFLSLFAFVFFILVCVLLYLLRKKRKNLEESLSEVN